MQSGDGEAVELHGSDPVEVASDPLLHRPIEWGAHEEPLSGHDASQLSFFDDERAALDDVPRCGEHRGPIGTRYIDRDVGISANAQMPFPVETEQPCWTGSGDDGDVPQ